MDEETQKYINEQLEEMGKNLTNEIWEKQTRPTRDAILKLIEALARIAHGAPHLTEEDQQQIKKLLGIG